MLILPAVDIRAGNCVMLKQGKIEDETVYSKDPAFMAKHWQMKGAKRVHVVDLDGAFQGMPKNFEIIKKIRATVDVPIQVGGGVRNMKTIDALFEAGVNYVIVGTLAIYNPVVLREAIAKYGEKIIVAIDARDNKVAIGGWKDTTSIDAVELTTKMYEMGVKEIIYTDIGKDGMLQGPNLEGLKKIAAAGSMRVIASGGVTNLDDITNLKALEPMGVSGIIVGKALYTEDLKIEEAIRIAEK